MKLQNARRRQVNGLRCSSLVESLETRRMLANVVVNTAIDAIFPPGTGLISLRSAIATANTATTSTTITFDPTVFATAQTITLNGSQLELSNTLDTTTITGPTAGVTVSGNNRSGVFQLDVGVTAAMSNLTVTGGTSAGITNNGVLNLSSASLSNNPRGPGLFNTGYASLINTVVSGNVASVQFGGGIRNTPSGTMLLNNVTVSGNLAFQGGGISNEGNATLLGVTMSGNRAYYGGGIWNLGTGNLTNVTIFGNSTISSNGGGGIANQGNVTLVNVTVAGNSSATVGGGIMMDAGTVTLSNSVVADNTASRGGPDVSGHVSSLGNNLIGKNNGSSGWVDSDSTGTIISPIDPRVGTLGNNGGLTQTMLPLTGSPLIDRGSNARIPAGINADQRGQVRISNETVDIGAVEVVPTISIVATDATSTEPASSSTPATDTGRFTISRTGPTTAALVVDLLITGTATSGNDYTSIPTTATIPIGAASTTINLTPNYDDIAEPTETVIVTLGTRTAYTIDNAQKAATVFIINTSPEVDLFFGTVAVVDGDTTPSTTDGTNFGAVNVGSPLTRTFTVKNIGTAPLLTSALGVFGVGTINPSLVFSIVEGLNAVIAPGTSDSFTVALSTGSDGIFTDELRFATNDPNENPYSFLIKGSIAPPAPAPEVDVRFSPSIRIYDNDLSPRAADGTDFGEVSQGTVGPTRTFTVYNFGDAPLTTSGLAVFAGSTNNISTLFSVVEGLSPVIFPASSDTITIRFNPNSVGSFQRQLRFNSNDGDETVYNFAIRGQVNAVIPVVSVRFGNVAIVDGDTTPSIVDGTDFVSAARGSAGIVRTFTVVNTGLTTLSLSGLGVFNPGTTSTSGLFSILNAPPATLAVGQSATFSVRLNTTTVGTHTRELRFNTSDPFVPIYNFRIRGIVTA